MVGRFARDVPPFLRTPVSPEATRIQVQRDLARREARFLDVAERLIYRNPRSPYRRLLQHAGCELGDLRQLVTQDGIEGALRTLAARGVSVTFDEFKGRREIERGSLRFAVHASDFDNPLARPHFARHTMGRSLEGVMPVVGGEPVTQDRRRTIETAGARITVIYSSVELTGLSYSCSVAQSPDDVHLMTHRFAVVQQLRAVSAGGPVVDALLLTTLTPWAAKVAFNTELGDYGRVEERTCGCLLGLRTHLTDVRSYEKLTGEGVTFVRTNPEQLVERTLPARFGGTSLDYQLTEEEAPGGITRLVLRIHPAVGEVDEADVHAVVLAELGREDLVARYHADLWQQAGTVQIRREPPLATQAGKVLPLHLLQRSERRV